MPIRLPDHSFTSTQMFGYIPSVGALMPGPTFSQGEDVFFTIYLVVDGAPLSSNDYRLDFIMKKSESANNEMYRSPVEKAPEGVEGYFQVCIPGRISTYLRPGTYYFVFEAVHKSTRRTVIVQKGTFNIVLTAASANPNLTIQDGELTTTISTEYGHAADTRTTTEITEPVSPDISRI